VYARAHTRNITHTYMHNHTHTHMHIEMPTNTHKCRSATLRRLGGDLAKISKRRSILENDLDHVSMPLVAAKSVDALVGHERQLARGCL